MLINTFKLPISIGWLAVSEKRSKVMVSKLLKFFHLIISTERKC